MQSPVWDNEAGRGRRSPRGRQDYGGAEAKTKKLFKQKAPRVLPSLSDAQTLVFALTVVYLFTVNLFYLAFFRHPKAVLLMCAAPLVAVPAMWARRSRSTFNLSLGAAVLCGLLLGVLAGLYCYASFGYFSWTYYSSRSYENVVSSEDPQIVADGAKITFAAEAFLDQSRSVGFKAPDGHLYCCAPIGSHAEAEAPVNFWAVGVDCCDLSGRFECDAAPKQTAHGLILLDEPFRWFRGTLRERFHDAKRKSAATFGIATGESEPVFLRWVTKEEYLDAQRFYDREALLFIVLSTFLVGASSSTLAWAFRPKDLSTALGV